jgi:hypothetical protein
VTWVQRFGGRLNLNIHFHALAAMDVLRCSECGGRRRVLAFLTDLAVVKTIFVHPKGSRHVLRPWPRLVLLYRKLRPGSAPSTTA